MLISQRYLLSCVNNKNKILIYNFLTFVFLFFTFNPVNGTPQFSNGYFPVISIPSPFQQMRGPVQIRRPPRMPQINYQPRHFRLPDLDTVSETLGAISTLGKYFFNSVPNQKQSIAPSYSHNNNNNNSKDKGKDDIQTAASQTVNSVVSSPYLKIKPEDDEELENALSTLGRNVLGKNVTSVMPILKSMNQIGRFLPPLIYRDGRIILGSFSNSSSNKDGNEQTAVCTTPEGNPGKCQDLSACPSLLLDLTNLRKSLCFKALFVPGVCCPNEYESATKSPIFIPTTTTTQRTTTTTTTKRPLGFPSITSLLSSLGGGSSSNNINNNNNNFNENILGRSDACGVAESPSFRIVGGDKSTPGMWPWMAAIFLHGPKGTEFWCGGTLINKRTILTASHCTFDAKKKPFSPRQFTVRLGDYDLLRSDDPSDPITFRVDKIITHPEFSGVGFYNDVAVLKLEKDVNYNRYVKPICLPTGRSKSNDFYGTYPTVLGWGTNRYGGRENSELHEAKLPVWSNSQCDKTYFQPITEIFICAGLPQGGVDACQGDSGGPLMLEIDNKWTQIGIVSFGNRCAEPGYPGVYTRLTKFLDWIDSNTN